ncbi:unnamed protein product [Didymodactylos carnosus]|uniref:Rab5 GDP/GTP exchange factor n=1 Tax=Didymodactylos carnosus TaxID=1234261 RepID=A0A815DAA4_9BILA|nr:unnamed protein product [Didymodactylos carnosus]CAF1295097.1 unnamed protein product [Didymodactylos carnosus]CAF4020570.1 unnamed protein product [Didymodactylos carnosus]CAF4108141.1 unnamed protein product [Didymodactylos carnosus]
MLSPSTKPDSELCRNACGFYGNKVWDDFCSKCYREVYQQAKQVQEEFDAKHEVLSPTLTNEAVLPLLTVQSSPSLTSFQERRRSNINMKNPVKQILLNRTGSLKYETGTILFIFQVLALSVSAQNTVLFNDDTMEQDAAYKHLDVMTTDDARLDIKRYVKLFSNSFQKKCLNKNVSTDKLCEDYSQFKDNLKKRIQTNSIYKVRVRDYVENIIFTKNYSLIFHRLSTTYEEQDLSIQNRISSLHWISTQMLETVLNEHIPLVRESIYKAINALIELDSKIIPQDKIQSIMECKDYIFDAIRNSISYSRNNSEQTTIINADNFLPALIYIVLKAKPPRLHSNIKFLSNFSQPSGEQAYYLANLDSAVRFIELLKAQHIGLSEEDFLHCMRGEPVFSNVTLFDLDDTNNVEKKLLNEHTRLYSDIDYHCEKFEQNLINFRTKLMLSTSDANDLIQDSYQRYSDFDKKLLCVDESPSPVDIQTSADVVDLKDNQTIPNLSPQDNKNDIFDQTLTASDIQLPEPLEPQILTDTSQSQKDVQQQQQLTSNQ